MPFVETYVDASAILDNMTDDELLAELRERKLGVPVVPLAKTAALTWCAEMRSAFYAHDANRFEALLAQAEPATAVKLREEVANG